MTARLYLDEDISPVLARALRHLGLDVVSAHEAGTMQLSDEDQLAFAAAQQRVLLTSNCIDFLAIARSWQSAERPHCGIIVSYRQYARDQIGEMTRTVARLLAAVSPEDLAGAVFVLDSFRVG